MKCPQCGFHNSADDGACRRCGQTLKKEFKTDTILSDQEKQIFENATGSDKPAAARPRDLSKTLATIKTELAEIEGKSPARNDAAAALVGSAPQYPRPYEPERDGPPEYAGFLIRLLAICIDGVLLGLIVLLLFIALIMVVNGSLSDYIRKPEELMAMLSGPFWLVCTVIEAFYFVYFHAVTGQTVGKLICGIQVLSSAGTEIGFLRSLLRYVGYMLAYIPLCLGFLWIGFDRKKQGWHDKLARTVVVRLRH
ncbi:RDD family protein [Thermodesulfobacteriota bacterium]